jgi:signal transduction histidine kinase
MTSFPVVVFEVDSMVAEIAAAILPAEDHGAVSVVALASVPGALGLGPRLHGLGVTMFSTPGEPQGGMRLFYVAGLALVVLVMAGSAALLWRDVRREGMVADLRSRFVAAVSHELKTPLTSIRLFAETLKRGTVTDERERQDYLDTIVAEGERLSRLINNVLDYGQIERGEKQYLRRPESLQDIVRDTVRSIDHPLRTQGYGLKVTMEEDLPDALVDRDAIEQAILNLLSNAMKYSGSARQVELRLRREGAAALIEVVDHGIGIPPEEQERIFEQFHRGRSASEAGIPGSGLGLTLVRHIANAHGGAVTVQSAPNAGSTFTLRLPLVPAQ